MPLSPHKLKNVIIGQHHVLPNKVDPEPGFLPFQKLLLDIVYVNRTTPSKTDNIKISKRINSKILNTAKVGIACQPLCAMPPHAPYVPLSLIIQELLRKIICNSMFDCD